MITIVNDGSNDATREILSKYEQRYLGSVKIVDLPDRGYDIRRVPNNINVAWERSEVADLDTDYFMVSGDDCAYPPDYAATMVKRMDADQSLVVASGTPSIDGRILHEHSPAGSGRFIRCSFWREAGGMYPLKAGWETWLLYTAQERGQRVESFQDVIFRHVRPRGTGHQFAYWGAAMAGLGYHPLYAMGRIVKNAITQNASVQGTMNMLRGYVAARLGSADPFISPFDGSLRRYVNQEQVQQIRNMSRKLLPVN
jgi:hypothetical protein